MDQAILPDDNRLDEERIFEQTKKHQQQQPETREHNMTSNSVVSIFSDKCKCHMRD